MASSMEPSMASPALTGLHLVGTESLRKRWGWFVALGAILMVFGLLAIGYSVVTTLAVTMYLGGLMVLAGAFQAVHAFLVRDWGGFFLDLLMGVLYMVFGTVVFLHPAQSAIALTLFIAILLVIGGGFRIAAALSTRFENRTWILLSGAVSLLLGLSIWLQWPLSGLVVLGVFVGVDMLFNGLSLLMLGLAARNLPARTA